MKRRLLLSVLTALAALLLPLAAGAGARPFPTAESAPLPTASPTGQDHRARVRLLLEGRVVTLRLDEYLQGVVAAEMPASFELEALKAQAVAARTFTRYRQEREPMAEHAGAEVCADSAHCKAYLSPEDAAARWGDDAPKNRARIAAAVAATDGAIITYENEPILAVFHSTSSGHTESAGDVWREDLPYLVGVESPGEESAPKYHGAYTLSSEVFRRIFLAAYPEADLTGDAARWFGTPERSSGGVITALSVGGVTVTGGELRQLFSLQSAHITVTVSGEEITLTTLGYGHGVGMSQYGAQAMALAGSDYREILTHYYTGVNIG